jgi:non-specific serine/threonine protein kinase
MSLTPQQIDQYITQNANESTILAAKKIILDNNILYSKKSKKGDFNLLISEGTGSKVQGVIISEGKDKPLVSCTCKNYQKGLCKHIVSGLLTFREANQSLKKISYNQKKSIVENFQLNNQSIENYLDIDLSEKIKDLNKQGRLFILSKNKGKFEINVRDNAKNHFVSLSFDLETAELKTGCNCTDTRHPLCSHKIFALSYLLKNLGDHAFEQTFDWTTEKEKLLNKYGLSLEDDWLGKVEFSFTSGQLELKIIDLDFVKHALMKKTNKFNSNLKQTDNSIENINNSYSIGYVLRKIPNNNLDILLVDVISGLFNAKTKKFEKHIQKLNSNSKNENLAQFKDAEFLDFFEFQKRFTIDYFDIHISETFPEFCALISSNPLISFRIHDKDIPVYVHFITFYLPMVHQLVEKLAGKFVFYPKTPDVTKYSKTDLTKINLSQYKLDFAFEYKELNNSIILTPVCFIDNKPIEYKSLKYFDFWFINFDSKFYTLKNSNSYIIILLTALQQKENLSFTKQTFPTFIERFIKPYQLHVIGMKPEMLEITEEIFEPVGKIRLSETGNFLLFYPTVYYGDMEISVNNPNESLYFSLESGYLKIARNKTYEKEFKDFIVGLHKSFNPNTFQEYFSLHCDDAMRRTWFIDFYHRCKQQGFEVYGFNNLKKFKFNPARPNTGYSISSGLDWFDLKVDVNFGDLQVEIADIRKSILKRENLVLLEDGSLGMLPDEWLDKWSDLLKYGSVSNNKIRVSKIHYTIIDKFYDELNDQKIISELLDKKKLLSGFNEIEKITIPRQLKATLRDYQMEGLNWLVFLTSFRWGGCLADDMGLGKTLQILALFCHLIEKNTDRKKTFLVVSPTTLIFNWQNEIKKFCPHLKEHIHYGINRREEVERFNEVDIILTSYGTLVNDIAIFKDLKFNCIVLDESQAIKNVNSQRFKAVNLLQADHRFVLTGTPIENNTLELYAQMHFANPGLLGSFSFYKDEFFEKIDKGKERGKISELVKLIRPFFLRRTKEEVAKDLPEKTEMILFCEMEEEQRKIYDSYRIEIRMRLLGKIDELGIEKAKFNILEGLLKLRQICDSPALLKTEENLGNSSAKCDELFRHILKKTGKHKILVFSQFLGMLDIIKKRLEIENINYVSLDGSTRNRKEIVEQFQQEENCRVFVLSLKAGGYGLNLTEADYVYLIDPWWNPAVEEQAIDRTHRIGQKNKVFAYRMICKNTIEEKILELQQKKRDLADEIISGESGFVKNLSRDDLDELLS